MIAAVALADKQLRVQHPRLHQGWGRGKVSGGNIKIFKKANISSCHLFPAEAHIGRFTAEQCILLIVRLAQRFPDLDLA